MSMEVFRRKWYSSLVRVCDGATTILSPVWIPSGSTFSMLQTVMQLSKRSRTTSYSQTVMQLSKRSRTTSYSISFHPRRDFSTSTWGEKVKAFVATMSSCASSSQKPEPSPPRA